jgi:hypothetical protein
MGVNSYDRSHPLEKYMREALCFPIYDPGNIGMQRRKIHGVMAHDSIRGPSSTALFRPAYERSREQFVRPN